MATGRVPLARKNLFQDRRRAMLSVAGVGLSLVLVLVLNGIYAGAMRQVTAYIRASPADVFVAQRDVRTMHMTQSVLPPGTVEAVRGVDGVGWAEPLRYTTSVVDSGRDSRLTYVFGYDTTAGQAGPQEIVRGRAPAEAQVVVDEVAADELGVDLGDEVNVLGQPFEISGLSANGTNIVNTTVYLRTEDFAAIRGDATAYLLVGAAPGAEADQLVARIGNEVPGVTAQTRDGFTRQEANVVRDMAADVMGVMTAIGFLIALAVVGLTLFSATLSKLREYGIMKALGAGSGRLAATVLAQAAWSVALGLLVAVGVSLALGSAVAALTPNVRIVLEARSLVETVVGASVVGALAATVPLRRVLSVDPATAFRSP